MKNKRKTMIMAMFVSIALLIVSGFVNAASISGYTIFKDSVRTTLNMRNATVRLHIYATVDGVLDEHSEQDMIFIKADLDNGVKYSKNFFNDSYCMKRPDPKGWIEVYQCSDGSVQALNYDASDSIFGIQPEWIRIVEILGDALSGSAKDYFFVSEQNGVKTVSANLYKEQVPEIVSAGFSLLHADSSRSELEYIPDLESNPNEALSEKINCGYIKKIEVIGINLTTVIDKNCNINNGNLEVTILFTDKGGYTNTGVAMFEFTAVDIGTTVIEIPETIMKKALE